MPAEPPSMLKRLTAGDLSHRVKTIAISLPAGPFRHARLQSLMNITNDFEKSSYVTFVARSHDTLPDPRTISPENPFLYTSFFFEKTGLLAQLALFGLAMHPGAVDYTARGLPVFLTNISHIQSGHMTRAKSALDFAGNEFRNILCLALLMCEPLAERLRQKGHPQEPLIIPTADGLFAGYCELANAKENSRVIQAQYYGAPYGRPTGRWKDNAPQWTSPVNLVINTYLHEDKLSALQKEAREDFLPVFSMDDYAALATRALLSFNMGMELQSPVPENYNAYSSTLDETRSSKNQKIKIDSDDICKKDLTKSFHECLDRLSEIFNRPAWNHLANKRAHMQAERSPNRLNAPIINEPRPA